jgi:hypothetical protein
LPSDRPASAASATPMVYPKHYTAIIWNLAESEQLLRCDPDMLSTVRSRSERAPLPPAAYLTKRRVY